MCNSYILVPASKTDLHCDCVAKAGFVSHMNKNNFRHQLLSYPQQVA